jgi:hypothetical protein
METTHGVLLFIDIVECALKNTRKMLIRPMTSILEVNRKTTPWHFCKKEGNKKLREWVRDENKMHGLRF